MNKILSKAALYLSLIIFSPLVVAQEAQDLIQLLNPMRSLQASFVQTILDNNGKAVQQSEGTMALQRPGQFRWSVERPIPQLIVADATRISIYDPDLQQLVIRPIAKAAGQTPAFLLSNMTDALKKDFDIQRMAAPQDWEWFSLTPRNKENMYSVIQLGFLNREIKEMRMQDSLGHRTVIKFQHVKINIALADSLFKIQPPANVDVIDETRSR